MREGSNRHVLHVVENLHRGAVETWLVRMLCHARQRGVELDWTFYCQLPREGEMAAEARELGARVVHSPVPIGDKLQFMQSLRAELKNGGYDILHAHHDLVSALYLVSSLGIPLGQRIVHVHNADEAVLTNSSVKRCLYRPLLRQTCLMLSDRIVGISEHTLDTFLDGRAPRPADEVHYYGIDATAFRDASGDRLAFRRDLGLPDEALILLFVGRVAEVKNPLFAVEVLAQMRRLDDHVCGVFVGTGGQEDAAADRVCELGLDDCVRMLGWRDDVPEIMTCCDWFIHPRLETEMEGLGLVLVEAQLAGLRLLVSQAVAPDPLLPNARVEQLPLAAGPARWAQRAVELLRQPDRTRAEAIADLGESSFDMDYALKDLLRLYE